MTDQLTAKEEYQRERWLIVQEIARLKAVIERPWDNASALHWKSAAERQVEYQGHIDWLEKRLRLHDQAWAEFEADG